MHKNPATAALTALALATAGAAAPAAASIITPGFTFSVASSSSNPAVGTHFHSNTGGAFGNPAGKAEVGRFGGEEVRGLSEYNLAGLTSSPSAFVTFNVFKAGGLFNGTNSTPFTGTISVFAYAGNNTEDLADYQAASLGTVGAFNVGPGVAAGDVFSFDISALFNQAIANGDGSLGIRLQAIPLNTQSQAWTFDSFRLTTDNQTTGAVPEPGTWLMLIVGFGAIAGAMRRRAAVRLRLRYG